MIHSERNVCRAEHRQNDWIETLHNLLSWDQETHHRKQLREDYFDNLRLIQFVCLDGKPEATTEKFEKPTI